MKVAMKVAMKISHRSISVIKLSRRWTDNCISSYKRSEGPLTFTLLLPISIGGMERLSFCVPPIDEVNRLSFSCVGLPPMLCLKGLLSSVVKSIYFFQRS